MRRRALTMLAAFSLSSPCLAEMGILGRVENASRSLLGVRYQAGPLGEGPDGEFDSDPLASFESVDCMTFVEETLALARAKDQAGMLEVLLKIRYRDGHVAYESRNHFVEADWLANNARAGFIRDITREVSGADAKTATGIVGKRAWYAAKTEKDLKGPRAAGYSAAKKAELVARWRALGASMPDENVSLPYLPIAQLAARSDRIPSGTIVALVRGDVAGSPTMVSHMGLIVRENGQAYFRHAALGDKVVDVPLDEYFRRRAEADGALLGLNLSRPLEP